MKFWQSRRRNSPAQLGLPNPSRPERECQNEILAEPEAKLTRPARIAKSEPAGKGVLK